MPLQFLLGKSYPSAAHASDTVLSFSPNPRPRMHRIEHKTRAAYLDDVDVVVIVLAYV